MGSPPGRPVDIGPGDLCIWGMEVHFTPEQEAELAAVRLVEEKNRVSAAIASRRPTGESLLTMMKSAFGSRFKNAPDVDPLNALSHIEGQRTPAIAP